MEQIFFKACPKCKGDIVTDHDIYGRYIRCLQCGRSEDAEAVKSRPQFVMPRQKEAGVVLARIHRRTRMDGVRAAEGGWVRELQGRWPGLMG